MSVSVSWLTTTETTHFLINLHCKVLIWVCVCENPAQVFWGSLISPSYWIAGEIVHGKRPA